MKRVLVYGMTSNNGGMEAYVMNYFSHFNTDKLVFDFVTDYETIAWKEEIEKLGGKVFYIPSRRKSLKSHMSSLRKIIKENDYSVVYFNLLSASGVFSVLAAHSVKGVKTVVHSHNDNVGNIKVHKILRPFLNMVTDYRLACSDEAGKFMFGDKSFNDGKIKVINNAIDTDKYKFSDEKSQKIRKELSLGDNFVIGHVGRMCFQKNSEFIIDIFNEVLKKKKDSVLLYVGDGEDRPLVEAAIKKYGIENNVVLTGMRNDVPDLYSAMDTFLLPSRFEGLAVVAVEAQTAGLPCFASTNVNPHTKLVDSFNFISLDEPAEKWADKILLSVGTERNRDVKEIAAKGFDINSEVEKLEKFFISL